MGERASIQFQKDDTKSVKLYFSRGRNVELLGKLYINDLFKTIRKYPTLSNSQLTRLEPETLMVDFIGFIYKNLNKVSEFNIGADIFPKNIKHLDCLHLHSQDYKGDNCPIGNIIIKVNENPLNYEYINEFCN